MTARSEYIETFIAESAAQHEPGIQAYGKRYKEHSHQALTIVFDQLCDQLAIATAIEVGAFQADFSRRFLAAAPGRSALAIEANPYNFQAFKDTLATTGVIYHHAAIQDQNGPCSLQLSVTDRDVKNGYIRGNNSILQSHQRPDTIPVTVPGSTLDDLVSGYVNTGQLKPLASSRTVLWIDAEGALDLVIAGGNQTITESLAIFAEVETRALWDDQAVLPEICHQLYKLGFIPFARDCEYEPDQFNVLFVREHLKEQPRLKELAISFSETLKLPPT